MRRYLLDTNSAGHCVFRRHGVHERVKQARKEGHKIGVGMPVVAELLAGIECSSSRDKNMDVVNRHLRLFRIWPFTEGAARACARLFAQLRSGGRVVQAMDLIAAIALDLGNCTVVTSDSDFDLIPGVDVENWKS